MQVNESSRIHTVAHQVRAVGKASKARLKSEGLKRAIRIFFYMMEYGSYLFTFSVLLAVRVIPSYPLAQSYNPLTWAKEIPVFHKYLFFIGVLLLIHAFMRVQAYLFSGQENRSFLEDFLFSAKSSVYAFLMTIGMIFLMKTSFYYSRLTLVTFLVLMIIEAFIWRGLYRIFVRFLNQRGYIRNQVLIIGAGKVGMDIHSQITQTRGQPNHFIGYLDDYKRNNEIIGGINELEVILQQQHVDIIYITIPSERNIIESILHTVYKYNVDIRIIPEMFDRMATVFTLRKDLDRPCLQIVKTPLRGMNVLLKRLADLLFSSLLLLISSPIFLLLALLIKLDSRGAVFFRQQRVGKNGIPFFMMKFRSMRMNAEQLKIALEEENEVSGPAFKLRNDPRITKIGVILRKYSLDELPQLWNVFKGEMSLIGPRPPLPEEVAKYTNYHWRRMDVLPGMTGLWQVSGRSNLDFEQWIDLDIYYIERWSLALEMKILLKTVPVVIKGTGAY